MNKIETNNKIKENDTKFNKEGIEYEINYIDEKWKFNKNNKKYKDNYYYNYHKDYKDNYKKNKNKHQKQYKNYNIFDEDKK